ncbi:MAG: hypothetical protein ACREJX_13595 [Polyangiaceae bacterium]
MEQSRAAKWALGGVGVAVAAGAAVLLLRRGEAPRTSVTVCVDRATAFQAWLDEETLELAELQFGEPLEMQPNERIEWTTRVLALHDAPISALTEMHLEGSAGLASGELGRSTLKEELRRMKMLIETGEIATGKRTR